MWEKKSRTETARWNVMVEEWNIFLIFLPSILPFWTNLSCKHNTTHRKYWSKYIQTGNNDWKEHSHCLAGVDKELNIDP